MAYNRFHKPIERYVPIPFEQLMVVGKELNEQRRQAEEDLHNYIRSASEFTSLLEKDVDSYYKTAMNDNIQRVIDEATQNPELMKSGAWRSSLASAINSVNYGQLAKYKASAEQAKLYSAAAKQLAMEGKLPPGWEPDYFKNYSTDVSGVFDATPLPYESMVDRIKPYVDNLKDSFLGTDGQYDYYGVDEPTLAKQIEIFKSDILSNPSNQRDIQRYVNNGMSLQKAADLILKQANTAALEYKHHTRSANPFAQINAKAAATARRIRQELGQTGTNNPGNGNGWFTNALTQTGQMTHIQLAQAFIKETMPEKYKEWSDAITKASLPSATAEEKAAGKKAQKEVDDAIAKVGYKDTYNYLFEKATLSSGNPEKDENGNEYYNIWQALDGAHAVATAYGRPVGQNQYEKIASRTKGLSANTKETPFGKTRVINGANNLELEIAALSNLTGFPIGDSELIKAVNDALQNGKFGEIIPVANNYVMGIPVGNNSINYFGQNIAIAEEVVTPQVVGHKDGEEKRAVPSGITAADLIRIGAKRQTVYPSSQYEQRTNKQTSEEDLSTVTISGNKPKVYYVLPVVNKLPSTGGGFDAHYLNQDIIQTEMTGSQSGKKQMENYYNSIMDDEQ